MRLYHLSITTSSKLGSSLWHYYFSETLHRQIKGHLGHGFASGEEWAASFPFFRIDLPTGFKLSFAEFSSGQQLMQKVRALNWERIEESSVPQTIRDEAAQYLHFERMQKIAHRWRSVEVGDDYITNLHNEHIALARFRHLRFWLVLFLLGALVLLALKYR